jgi:hypothetical protein
LFVLAGFSTHTKRYQGKILNVVENRAGWGCKVLFPGSPTLHTVQVPAKEDEEVVVLPRGSDDDDEEEEEAGGRPLSQTGPGKAGLEQESEEDMEGLSDAGDGEADDEAAADAAEVAAAAKAAEKAAAEAAALKKKRPADPGSRSPGDEPRPVQRGRRDGPAAASGPPLPGSTAAPWSGLAAHRTAAAAPRPPPDHARPQASTRPPMPAMVPAGGGGAAAAATDPSRKQSDLLAEALASLKGEFSHTWRPLLKELEVGARAFPLATPFANASLRCLGEFHKGNVRR